MNDNHPTYEEWEEDLFLTGLGNGSQLAKRMPTGLLAKYRKRLKRQSREAENFHRSTPAQIHERLDKLLGEPASRIHRTLGTLLGE